MPKIEHIVQINRPSFKFYACNYAWACSNIARACSFLARTCSILARACSLLAFGFTIMYVKLVLEWLNTGGFANKPPDPKKQWPTALFV